MIGVQYIFFLQVSGYSGEIRAFGWLVQVFSGAQEEQKMGQKRSEIVREKKRPL